MTNSITSFIATLDDRLATLDGLLTTAEAQLGKDRLTELLSARLAPDMFPLGRQVSIVGNMPRAFAFWCAGQPTETSDSDIADLDEAHAHLAETRRILATVTADDSQLAAEKPMNLPNGLSFTLSGRDYADQWVLPNVYFHMVTAYNILRANGVEIGKRDYMAHLLPTIMAQMAAKQG